MKQHFVTFYSPGTFLAEDTTKPIISWDVDVAVKMARKITERYNATPYGFCFATRTRTAKDLDSKETARSGMYFLGGTVRTLAEVKAANDPDEKILLRNMEGNHYERVITNCNSWKWTQPLKKGDVVLPFNKKMGRPKKAS